MKTPIFPGFTGEASLYTAIDRYYLNGASSAQTKGTGIIPQDWRDAYISRSCFDFRCELNPLTRRVYCWLVWVC
jgi:hypothetical protein